MSVIVKLYRNEVHATFGEHASDPGAAEAKASKDARAMRDLILTEGLNETQGRYVDSRNSLLLDRADELHGK